MANIDGINWFMFKSLDLDNSLSLDESERKKFKDACLEANPKNKETASRVALGFMFECIKKIPEDDPLGGMLGCLYAGKLLEYGSLSMTLNEDMKEIYSKEDIEKAKKFKDSDAYKEIDAFVSQFDTQEELDQYLNTLNALPEK
jgi:hypothetical protein